MVYNSFKILLDPICSYLKDFYTYIHEGFRSVVFFNLLGTVFGFGIRIILAAENELGLTAGWRWEFWLPPGLYWYLPGQEGWECPISASRVYRRVCLVTESDGGSPTALQGLLRHSPSLKSKQRCLLLLSAQPLLSFLWHCPWWGVGVSHHSLVRWKSRLPTDLCWRETVSHSIFCVWLE